MKVFLGRRDIYLSKTTVHKYMNKEMKLKSICRRKKPNYKKGNAHRLFPNLLKQNFVAPKPNRVWCTDFTYPYLTNGTVRYNRAIIDLTVVWLRVKMVTTLQLIWLFKPLTKQSMLNIVILPN